MRPLNAEQPICRLQTRILPPALLIVAALTLAGCGGGGGGGGSAIDTTAGTTGAPAGSATGLTGTSTLLEDNTVQDSASFNNFAATGLQLTVAGILASEQITFSGDRTFLKLGLPDGQVLFLGEVNRDQALDLLVDLPLGTTAVRYEIFSDSPLDDTLFGEITI